MKGLQPANAAHDDRGTIQGIHPARALDGASHRDPPTRETVELVLGGHTHPLEGEGPWGIGRFRGNDIVIPDPNVSRRHARLSRAEDGFVVEDLGSTNGTLLDGTPIVRERVEGGDELTFAGVAARFVCGTEEEAPSPPKTRGVRLPYLPGLDGLRALAVIAVLLYHAELRWIPGGFIGVEVFFVISGYLITALLLAEWRQRGRIDLKAFWLRRARRLLPALYLLLVVTLAFAVVFLPGEVARLRADVLAAFGYVTNWYLIFANESYFEAVGRPSLLKHLWSLAIEEQFYLLWPLLLAVGLRWRHRLVLVAVLAGAAASSLLMAALYQPDVDPSRLYYGADTRAAGLLIGAALAFVWAPGRSPAEMDLLTPARRRQLGRAGRLARFRRRWRWISPLLLDVIGLAALGGLVWLCLRLGEFQPFLYRGGLASVSLTTAVLIMVLVHPHARLSTGLLGWSPLRWVGLRSYGIYLWHWPVFMVTRPQLDVPIDGLPLVALRLAATVVLAALSYSYVETPIRTGALGRAWKALREAQGTRRWQLRLRWTGAAVAAAALSALLGVAVVQAKPSAPPSYLSSMEAIHTAQPTHGTPSAGAETDDLQDTQRPRPQEDRGAAPARTQTAAASEKPGKTAKLRQRTASAAAPADTSESVGMVTAIGDSVMLGSAAGLQKAIPELEIMDAEVGLQVSEAIGILRARRVAGELGDVVVVHLGSNGTFTAEQFDEMMGVLGEDRRVVLVNTKVPRTWEQPNNQVIAEGVQQYPNAVLVDWYAASVDHPEYFWGDGIHLCPRGTRVYAGLIAASLEAS